MRHPVLRDDVAVFVDCELFHKAHGAQNTRPAISDNRSMGSGRNQRCVTSFISMLSKDSLCLLVDLWFLYSHACFSTIRRSTSAIGSRGKEAPLDRNWLTLGQQGCQSKIDARILTGQNSEPSLKGERLLPMMMDCRS